MMGETNLPAWLPRLLLVALALALLIVSVSGYIRLVETGLGCEDWPACYGFYHYNESAQGVNVLMEQGEQSPHRTARVSHRLVTSTLGAIILFVFVTSWRRPGYQLGKVVPSVLLLLTVVLASIGRIHPSQPLPILTLGNFMGGLLLVVLIFYLYLRVNDSPSRAVKTPFTPLIRLGMLVVVTQVILGGWTSANYAGASCKGLFECSGVIQENTGQVEAQVPAQSFFSVEQLELNESNQVIANDKMSAVQFAHHIIAAVTLFYFVFLFMLLVRSERRLQNSCMVVLVMVFAQCLIGVVALAFEMPLLVISLHNLLSAFLLIAITSLNVKTSLRGSL